MRGASRGGVDASGTGQKTPGIPRAPLGPETEMRGPSAAERSELPCPSSTGCWEVGKAGLCFSPKLPPGPGSVFLPPEPAIIHPEAEPPWGRDPAPPPALCTHIQPISRSCGFRSEGLSPGPQPRPAPGSPTRPTTADGTPPHVTAVPPTPTPQPTKVWAIPTSLHRLHHIPSHPLPEPHGPPSRPSALLSGRCSAQVPLADSLLSSLCSSPPPEGPPGSPPGYNHPRSNQLHLSVGKGTSVP